MLNLLALVGWAIPLFGFASDPSSWLLWLVWLVIATLVMGVLVPDEKPVKK